MRGDADGKKAAISATEGAARTVAHTDACDCHCERTSIGLGNENGQIRMEQHGEFAAGFVYQHSETAGKRRHRGIQTNGA